MPRSRPSAASSSTQFFRTEIVDHRTTTHPAAVIDTLRTPGLREAVDVRAVIGLVDPRHTRSPRHLASEPWQDQIRIADILVANKVDLATEEDLAAFPAMAAEAWPPKLVVAETRHGRLDPAWLDAGPPRLEVASTHVHHEHTGADSKGFVWRPRAAFDRDALEQVLQTLVRPGEALGEVYTLYVDPDWQGRDIGRSLLASLFGALAAEGRNRAIIWVLAANPSRFFYEAVGGVRTVERIEKLWGTELPEIGYCWDDLSAALAPDGPLGKDRSAE